MGADAMGMADPVPGDMDAVTYSETSDRDQVRAVPLAHLSVELGHFYMEDLLNGEDRIRAQFRRVATWVGAATASAGVAKPRVSTCFLIDDYFRHDTAPAEILGRLLPLAEECGLRIDYLAREAGCCVSDDIPLAETAAAMLLPEPAPGSNGSRPPTHESGWLCNGQRSQASRSDQAMRAGQWKPPQEFGKRNHSIFLDVELWREAVEQVDGRRVAQRTWSCPFLAAVWQLLRLGMLRYRGEPVAVPQPWECGTPWPEHWDEMPTVLRLNPQAAPFAAYRSLSIMPQSYLPIEHAVRLILGHLQVDERVNEQVLDRAASEGITVPRGITERVEHVFFGR